ncbi:MAG TPA: N,N-dimethylformamidase beta subunit family domain-containing protein [Solirubrobacteraceae bacterium]|nr:N,N-dimethylformamidase beta subunit family domain-containing protein [Solirubrobacteraceae bacterium]
MPRKALLAIGATSAALVLGACGRSSPATTTISSAAADPVQHENARPGTPGWQIPAGAGTVITGYASETSVAPGQSVHLHVAAPPGSRYRVLVYRLGWYGGIGGRLVLCVPGCRSSRAAIAQPPPTTAGAVTGLFRAPWRVTDRVAIPRDAVSGYYEAKLEVVGGAHAGAVGGVPLIVRQSPAAPASAVLVQVPVNTWEAYNGWGGKSLYQFGTSRHALEVSFDRPFDQRVLHDMGTALELPWVRFLERDGVDVSYQTDADTDAAPRSLLRHRLVFAIGHDEYWTQRMRDAFDRALARSTNLMFGSNSGEWRMRYAAGRREIVEWRDPSLDPAHDRRLDNGFFRTFGEPECKLMGVEHGWAAQRDLSAPPTPYMVVGPAGDPWLTAAGLAPGDVIPGVVGYEWDSLSPGCFTGRVVPLMTAVDEGSDGVFRSADMVRATAPSGGRVFAMGTMELAWALGDMGGRPPDRRVVALAGAALRDLTRPAPPAALTIRRRATGLLVSARLRASDPRVVRVTVRPLSGGRGCADGLRSVCRLPLPRRTTRYDAVAVDRWGASRPLIVTLRAGPGGDVRDAEEQLGPGEIGERVPHGGANRLPRATRHPVLQ